MEERLQTGANKWRKGLFEERSEDTDGDQQMQNQNRGWRPDASAKRDMIGTGKWMQKAVWNRWMTTMERDQSHKTPITSTWTTDLLTREGEGLQTNAGVFPCEARLQKWGKHPDGVCELCKHYREMDLKLLGGRPARDTTGHLQNSVSPPSSSGYRGSQCVLSSGAR
jgi:hypothetical protein